MAEKVAPPVGQKPASGSYAANAGAIQWDDLVPKSVDDEDSMSAEKVKVVWLDMYARAGLRNPSEGVQAAFRLAVYVYAAKNATSRQGNYRGSFTLADGTKVDASVIPAATGKMNIRRFFRGNMEESYVALKRSRAMEQEKRFIAKAADLGITSDCAFATADWLAGCPDLTPAEAAAHNKSFVNGLERAKRSRGGKTLEDVEDGLNDKELSVQGRFDAPLPGKEVTF